MIAALLSVGTLAACEEEGPAEKLGKTIDQTADETAKAVEEATKQAGALRGAHYARSADRPDSVQAQRRSAGSRPER